MKQPLYTNALSRHTDLYICDACGMEEAILDYMHAPLTIEVWAALLQNSNRIIITATAQAAFFV